MKNLYLPLTLTLFLLILLSSCRKDEEIVPSPNLATTKTNPSARTSTELLAPSSSVQTRRHDGSWAVRWMQLAYNLVAKARISPPVASRFYGYTGLAIYESVVNGMPTNTSLSGILNEMPPMPKPNSALVYDWPTVMNRTVSLVIKNALNSPNAAINTSIDSLYALEVVERGGYVNQTTIQNSITYGMELGNALIAYANTDYYLSTRTFPYTAPPRSINPAFWEPTAPGQVAIEPYWGMIRPFGLTSSDAAFIEMPFPYSTEPTSRFYQDALEVRDKRYSLTAEEKEIATFWADNAGQTGTPPGHWISIANLLVLDQQINLRRTAIIYLKLGVIIADAFISCWDSKFKVNLLRPKTYIRETLGDPSWESFIPTPPFPEFTSGHSVVSGAAAVIMTRFFGEIPFTDHTHVFRGLASRSFTSFNEAAQEAALSRLYGGIHYRFSIEKGLKQGKDVAVLVLNRINIKDTENAN